MGLCGNTDKKEDKSKHFIEAAADKAQDLDPTTRAVEATKMAQNTLHYYDKNNDGKIDKAEAKDLMPELWKVGLRAPECNDFTKQEVKDGTLNTTTQAYDHLFSKWDYG